jgi:8-oxo-dGTP diphosphatase
MKDYFKLIPAAYLILHKDGKILMLKRANTSYFDGSYSLPAGHIEADESASKAAAREAKEEIGIDVDPSSLRLKHTLHRISDIPVRHERIDLFFEADTWEGEVVNAEPTKCSELAWVEINKLPTNIVPEVKQALQNIDQGEPYSEFNF